MTIFSSPTEMANNFSVKVIVFSRNYKCCPDLYFPSFIDMAEVSKTMPFYLIILISEKRNKHHFILYESSNCFEPSLRSRSWTKSGLTRSRLVIVLTKSSLRLISSRRTSCSLHLWSAAWQSLNFLAFIKKRIIKC